MPFKTIESIVTSVLLALIVLAIIFFFYRLLRWGYKAVDDSPAPLSQTNEIQLDRWAGVDSSSGTMEAVETESVRSVDTLPRYESASDLNLRVSEGDNSPPSYAVGLGTHPAKRVPTDVSHPSELDDVPLH